MRNSILLLALILGCSVAPVDAKPEAKRWAQEMGYNVKGVSCAGRDSDMDGYVSCSINVADHDEPLAVECNYVWGSGCKVTEQLKMRTRKGY